MGGDRPGPPGQKRDLMDPPLITKGYCIEELSRVKKKLESREKWELGDGMARNKRCTHYKTT